MQDLLFITWIEHRRTRRICSGLDIPLVEIVSNTRGLLRYSSLALRTIKALARRTPRVLIVQSPSIVLALLALMLRPLLGFRLVLDAHNEAIEPFLHRSSVIVFLSSLLLRQAELTIVSNNHLSETVRRHGGLPFVLPDGIPDVPSFETKHLPGAFRIVLISTFADDEPIGVVIQAARVLGSRVQIYVTGNPHKLSADIRSSLPANMTLTGFLPDKDYWSLLGSSDAVMDLTTMPNCLVCGAYEAMAMDKPLLLSRNQAGLDLFGDSAVFTENDGNSLVSAINILIQEHSTMLRKLPIAKRAFEEQWKSRADELLAYLRQPI